jgi:hypothetical protein
MRLLCLLGMGILGLSASLAGCGDDSTGGGGLGVSVDVPTTYRFERDGASTIAHDGQTTRQVLIADLSALMESISADVLAGKNLDRYDTADEVYALLFALYSEGALADPNREIPGLVAEGDSTLQSVYADLGDANLQAKLAGNDAVTDHKDWDGDRRDDDPDTNGQAQFVGWSEASLVIDSSGNTGEVRSPEALLLGFFYTFADQVAAAATESSPFPTDATIPVYLTPEGLDLTQLVQKFLLGAVNFSQTADDYLDDDVPGKGLLTPNMLAEDANYSQLEHAWDEGFGYWGAAADYSQYSDDEIAGEGGRPQYANGYFDSNGDAMIDLRSEYNFGASANAAKRDRAAILQTDLTAQADQAWRTGRALITAAYESGQEIDLDALLAQRLAAILSWEKAYAATAIHYINELLADMDSIDGAYSFADHAKHWSELKGFALSFQFNPVSPMSDEDFEILHVRIGDRPVGASPSNPEKNAAYRSDLINARTLIGDTYGFDSDNIENW